MDSSDIRTIALEINRFKGSAAIKKTIFETKYPVFFESYKTLATMCCDGRVDEQRLIFMLKTFDKVQNNATTQEKASENIGQELFNTYIQPKVHLMKFPENSGNGKQ